MPFVVNLWGSIRWRWTLKDLSVAACVGIGGQKLEQIDGLAGQVTVASGRAYQNFTLLHAEVGASREYNQARATRQSRTTVGSEIPRTSAISEFSSPPK